MIINEFLRLSYNFEIFSSIIDYFENKINSVNDIFEIK